jgi:hypothetical protein
LICLLAGCAASPPPPIKAAPPRASPAPSAAPSEPDPFDRPKSESETTIIREPELDTEPLTCSGEVSEKLNQELGIRAGETKLCYEKLLSRNPDARGRMLVGATFDERGNVASYRVEEGAFGDSEFSACVDRIVGRAVHDTPPEKGCVNVQIPLNYQPTSEGSEGTP